MTWSTATILARFARPAQTRDAGLGRRCLEEASLRKGAHIACFRLAFEARIHFYLALTPCNLIRIALGLD